MKSISTRNFVYWSPIYKVVKLAPTEFALAVITMFVSADEPVVHIFVVMFALEYFC